MLQGGHAPAPPNNETLEIARFHVSGVVILRPKAWFWDFTSQKLHPNSITVHLSVIDLPVRITQFYCTPVQWSLGIMILREEKS